MLSDDYLITSELFILWPVLDYRALLYIKGVENDGSSTLRDLGATFTNIGNAKDFEDKIDPVILKQNTELKLDCFNNLSGNKKIIYLPLPFF